MGYGNQRFDSGPAAQFALLCGCSATPAQQSTAADPARTAKMEWGSLAGPLSSRLLGELLPSCLQRRLALVTRNESGFAYSNVTVINPWAQ
jgi:hypothetical protein